MSREKKNREILLRVIAPTLSDIAEFYARLQKVCVKVYPTGQRRSELEDTWRAYFVVVLEGVEANE